MGDVALTPPLYDGAVEEGDGVGGVVGVGEGDGSHRRLVRETQSVPAF